MHNTNIYYILNVLTPNIYYILNVLTPNIYYILNVLTPNIYYILNVLTPNVYKNRQCSLYVLWIQQLTNLTKFFVTPKYVSLNIKIGI